MVARPDAAVAVVGGAAFAKTILKSAKNNVKMRQKRSGVEVIAELTANTDVFLQCLQTST